MAILEWLFQGGFTLKKVASTSGGEWAGPCPFCGGRDRFRVWPQTGRYWCRGCGRCGDAVQFLRDFRGLSFHEACHELERELSFEREHYEDKSKSLPPLKWQEKSKTFLARAEEALRVNQAAMDWLRGRGLRDDTIRAARLGWNPRDRYEERISWGLEQGKSKGLWLPAGLVIPLVLDGGVIRLRIRRPEAEPRYVIVPGSDTRPMVFDRGQRIAMIVESELDALLVDQEAGDLTAVVALGSAQKKPDQGLSRFLKGAALLLVSLDFDKAGARASWTYWLKGYPNALRWPTPYGKDPSEALQKGLSIRAWIEAGLSGKIFEVKDNSQVKPFPKEWLSKYDVTILERLAIMTVDGGLSDSEALRFIN